MQTVNNLKPPRTRLWQPRVLGGGLGLSIFVYYVTRIGLKDVTEGVAKIGLAFPIILALSGLRFAVRTLAWMRCIEGETQLRFNMPIQRPWSAMLWEISHLSVCW